MADPIPAVARKKQQDDNWTTFDANAGPRASERQTVAFDLEHREGVHLYPAASAAALVHWTGSAYDVLWSEGFDSISAAGTGVIEATLLEPMRDAESWMLVGIPQTGEPYGCEELASGTKNQFTAQVRIYNNVLSPSHQDCLLLAFGVRL